MSDLAITYHADCGRLLRALGIDGRHVSRVTIDLLPGSIVRVEVESSMTSEALADFVDELEKQPLERLA